MKTSLLIVDDETPTRSIYTRFLSPLFTVDGAENIAGARELLSTKTFGALLLDLKLPDGSGLDFLLEIRSLDPDVAIVVITGSDDVRVAVEAMRRGADHFLVKPIDLRELELFLAKSVEIGSLRRSEAAHRRLKSSVSLHFGNHPATRAVRETLETIACPSEVPVLLLGETGTGKGVLARWIHDNGPRRDAPFVGVNCSSLHGEMLNSELFGHARGAFTSAVASRQGLIEVADGGTLFLDEVGDMDATVQAQLLKVVEEKRFRRLGENLERRSDFRIIAATNKDLERQVARGYFRSDLFYRLNVLPIRVPSLRERASDIPGLVRELLRDLGYSDGRITEEALAALQTHDWPGNVRELKNLLERAVLLARGAPVCVCHFRGLTSHQDASCGDTLAHRAEAQDTTSGQDILKQALDETGGSVDDAAKLLGISRATFYRRMKCAGLSKPRNRS